MSSRAASRLEKLVAHVGAGPRTTEILSVQQCAGDAKSSKDEEVPQHGGNLAAKGLLEQNVKVVFTLTGGHISPILVGCNQAGIRVVDVRDEATTVFAADAVSRLTGTPGVGIVTAGPGLTNTITAVKNAQMAQSPVVVLAGCTSMLLRGRGSLQDIDQFALMKPHCKLMISIKSLSQIIPAIRSAFRVAQEGVPGPVFIEFPLETLWPQKMTEELMGVTSKPTPLKLTRAGLVNKVQQIYIARHVQSVFKDAWVPHPPLASVNVPLIAPKVADVNAVHEKISLAQRPVILIGSQAVRAKGAKSLVQALENIGAPVFLSGMGRGLLGKEHRLLMKHKRSNALGKADFVMLCGVPADFRLDYGRHLNKHAVFVSINLCAVTLKKNSDLRKPALAALADPLNFMVQLGEMCKSSQSKNTATWKGWFQTLQELQEKREKEILQMMKTSGGDEKFVNPLILCKAIDAAMDEDSIIVADGGDFVGTASYIVRPRCPLGWLDPGVFGTLGVGGGFALGAKVVRPNAECWVLFGDGALGWSIVEFDTMVRHKIPVIAVIGNDACWSQMYRDQVRLLKDTVATELAYTQYEDVAKGFGAEGILVRTNEEIKPALAKAKELAKKGKAVLVNVLIAKSTFREGSISL